MPNVSIEEARQMWAAELRSGKWKQEFGLWADGGTGRCALGVWDELHLDGICVDKLWVIHMNDHFKLPFDWIALEIEFGFVGMWLVDAEADRALDDVYRANAA